MGMGSTTLNARDISAHRLAELALAAGNAARLLFGARMSDARALPTLAADADAALRTARIEARLPSGWRLGDRLTTVADIAVIEVRDGDELAAVLKLSRSPAGDESLTQQHATRLALAAEPGLEQWCRRIPEVLAQGQVGKRSYSVERAALGRVGRAALSATTAQDARREAVRAVAGLHRATGRPTVASPAMVESWLQPGLSLVVDTPMLLGAARRRALIESLRERLHAGLEGRTVWIARTHGDYTPGNVFHGPAAEVTEIIDWGQSREDDAALIDPMTYLLVERASRRGGGLGALVGRVCRGERLPAEDIALLELHRTACPAEPLAVDVTALLAWLRHVENNLLKSPRYRSHPVWVRRTIETVLTSAGTTRV
jgi:Ser/Thr protein kinase RdoA (MazF antagonist)